MAAQPALRPRQRRPASARALPSPLSEGMRQRLEEANALVRQPLRGITMDGEIHSNLFYITKTGVPTGGAQASAEAFLASLTPAQRRAASFRIDSDAWRRWSNIHVFLMRHGALLEDMDERQRASALALLAESLSSAGFTTARNVMKLNETIREITGSDAEYGEWLYWLSIFGTPSAQEPWGWQIDGHHLIVNCFLLGDQIVMTPTFMGSEPVEATTGKYAGVGVFREEERQALTLMQSLTANQRKKAIISDDLPSEVFTTAFRDNFELHYEGIRYDGLSSSQQAFLVRIVETYVGRMRQGHAQVKMREVQEHLSETYLAWMGGFGEDSVFYYRVHSPVILIEFDHQRGVALDNDTPSRNHIHTVVRTPNGDDYGADLLRQHREHHQH